MVLVWFEVKKTISKMWHLLCACFCLNLLGMDSISRNLDSKIVLSRLFGKYLPNITLECVMIGLLLTHCVTGYEYAEHTESLIYSARIGRKHRLYKLAAAIFSTYAYAIVLFGASLAVYFIKGGMNSNWPLFFKVLPVSFALILLFVLFAFAFGTFIRSPWIAAITTISIQVFFLGLVMNFENIHPLRLVPMGLLVSQKSWFTNMHGAHFELSGLGLSGIALTILCISAYSVFRRRDI